MNAGEWAAGTAGQEVTTREAARLRAVLYELKKVVVGQDHTLERLLGSEPGPAGQFSRIHFTPDPVPSDIVGTRVYRASMERFEVELGPRPFLVLATQNPIESEGVYPLPEAQRDRFLMKVVVAYPAYHEELEIVRHSGAWVLRDHLLAKLHACGRDPGPGRSRKVLFCTRSRRSKVRPRDKAWLRDKGRGVRAAKGPKLAGGPAGPWWAGYGASVGSRQVGPAVPPKLWSDPRRAGSRGPMEEDRGWAG